MLELYSLLSVILYKETDRGFKKYMRVVWQNSLSRHTAAWLRSDIWQFCEDKRHKRHKRQRHSQVAAVVIAAATPQGK
jgi:hypothetical protein